MEVNIWIVLVQPGESKYHALLTKPGDCEQDMFRVLVIGHDYIDDFVNASGFIEGSIHIVDWNQLGQLAGQKLGLGDEILVYKIPSSTSVNHSVCCLQVDREQNALQVEFKRADVVIESPVRSGYLPFLALTKTLTS